MDDPNHSPLRNTPSFVEAKVESAKHLTTSFQVGNFHLIKGQNLHLDGQNSWKQFIDPKYLFRKIYI